MFVFIPKKKKVAQDILYLFYYLLPNEKELKSCGEEAVFLFNVFFNFVNYVITTNLELCLTHEELHFF